MSITTASHQQVKVTQEVTVAGNGQKPRLDISLQGGKKGDTIDVPDGMVAYDRKTGEKVDKITLGHGGRAGVEVKTGKASESTQQTAGYNACESGTAVGCGKRADDAGYLDQKAPEKIYILRPVEDVL